MLWVTGSWLAAAGVEAECQVHPVVVPPPSGNSKPMAKVAGIWNRPPQECVEFYLHIPYKHFAVGNVILALSLEEHWLWTRKISVCLLILIILISLSYVELLCEQQVTGS